MRSGATDSQLIIYFLFEAWIDECSRPSDYHRELESISIDAAELFTERFYLKRAFKRLDETLATFRAQQRAGEDAS
jgi:hypothetical protein